MGVASSVVTQQCDNAAPHTVGLHLGDQLQRTPHIRARRSANPAVQLVRAPSHGSDRGGVGHRNHPIHQRGNEARLHPRSADPFDLGARRGNRGIPVFPSGIERRTLRIDHTEPGVVLLQAGVAANGGAGAAGASSDDDPGRYGKRLAAQLIKYRLGDVVVAPPVGGPFGVSELVEVVPAAARRKISRDLVDRCRILDERALPTVELDQLDLLLYGRCRHHSHERHIDQPGEIGLADCGGSGGSLDECGALMDPVVAEAIKHQGSGQPMLQAAGWMHRLVFQIETDTPVRRQRKGVHVSIGAAIRVRLDLPDRPFRPGAIALISLLHHR